MIINSDRKIQKKSKDKQYQQIHIVLLEVEGFFFSSKVCTSFSFLCLFVLARTWSLYWAKARMISICIFNLILRGKYLKCHHRETVPWVTERHLWSTLEFPTFKYFAVLSKFWNLLLLFFFNSRENMRQSSRVLVSKHFKMSPFLNTCRIAFPCSLEVRLCYALWLMVWAEEIYVTHGQKASVLELARFPSSDLVIV